MFSMYFYFLFARLSRVFYMIWMMRMFPGIDNMIAFSWLEIDTFRKLISLVFIKSIVPRRLFFGVDVRS